MISIFHLWNPMVLPTIKNMYETIIKIDNILKNNENYERHVFDKIVVYSLKDLNKFQFLELKYQ